MPIGSLVSEVVLRLVSPGDFWNLTRQGWADIEPQLFLWTRMTSNILQLAASYQALASDGVYRRPRIVAAIEKSMERGKNVRLAKLSKFQTSRCSS